jgi:hypothetical protein
VGLTGDEAWQLPRRLEPLDTVVVELLDRRYVLVSCAGAISDHERCGDDRDLRSPGDSAAKVRLSVTPHKLEPPVHE